MSYKQTIYNTFRKNGLTEAAALGFLGNFQCESGNEPFRLQGDFSPYRTSSKAYVQRAENGQMTKQEFCKAVGFGLAQWTYPARKANLWDFWKASGKALDSAEMQTEFACQELRTEYKALFDFLKSTNDVFTATSRICREYERPAVNNIDARYQAANRIKYEIDLNAWDKDEPDPAPAPSPAPEPQKSDKLVLRTIDKNCKGFDEIYLLQALLLNHGYDIPVDGVWTESLTDAVKEFQKTAFPNSPKDWDGVVGKMTWDALLKR